MVEPEFKGGARVQEWSLRSSGEYTQEPISLTIRHKNWYYKLHNGYAIKLNHYQPAIPEKYHSFIVFDIVTCALITTNFHHIFYTQCLNHNFHTLSWQYQPVSDNFLIHIFPIAWYYGGNSILLSKYLNGHTVWFVIFANTNFCKTGQNLGFSNFCGCNFCGR